MNKWLIIHDLLAYSQHRDKIGSVVKAKGLKQPKSVGFSNIKKGDIVVYYASKDCVITGFFEVVSDMEYIETDSQWNEIMIYKIKQMQMPPEGKYLDFKKLVKDAKTRFDLFPRKSMWGTYLQGRTCVLLTDKDYLTIKNALSHQEYLKKIDEIKITPTKWHKKPDSI